MSTGHFILIDTLPLGINPALFCLFFLHLNLSKLNPNDPIIKIKATIIKYIIVKSELEKNQDVSKN